MARLFTYRKYGNRGQNWGVVLFAQWCTMSDQGMTIRSTITTAANSNSERAQPDERGPSQGAVELRICSQKQVPQSADGSDEFTDNCSDYGQSHSDFRARENERQRRRKLNFQKDLKWRSPQRTCKFEQSCGCRPHSCCGIDDDRKKRDKKGDHELRLHPQSKPNQDDRSDGNFWNGLRCDENRIEREIENARICDTDGKRNSNRDGQRESQNAFEKCRPAFTQQHIPIDDRRP